MIVRHHLRRVVLLSTLFVTGSVLAATPEEIWSSIGSATLDLDRAVAVSDLQIEMGAGSLSLEDGVLIPAKPIADRTLELLFLGAARFRIDPEERLERQQLRLFTESPRLDVPLTQVVLTAGDPAVMQHLLERPPIDGLDPGTAETARSTFAEWVDGTERRGFGVSAGILKAALGDTLHDRFFVAWCRSEELGDFYYALDPAAGEQVTLGQFVPLELDDLEAHRAKKRIKKSKRKGRYKQLRFEDLGDWDTWVSAPLTDASGEPTLGRPGLEARSYSTDVSVTPKDQTLRGTTRVTIDSTHAGLRVATLSLYSDLTVTGVEGADGSPLSHFRVKERLHVVLPEATAGTGTLELVIHYEGTVLYEIEKGIFALLDTYSWYPRIGAVDRATYDVTLRWPAKHELLASGREVESGEESGVRCQRRTLDLPAIAFSFEVGAYDVRRFQAGDVAVTIGFARTSWPGDKGVKDEVIETVQDALVFLEDRFGEYPLDYLTIATVPRPFSQGFLGFVTLSHYLLAAPRGGWRILSVEDLDDPGWRRREGRRETIAHELSHQWWGNKVGWDSYRDQWLSEALADFSATLFAAQEADRKSVYLARHARGWKRTLGRGTSGGKTVESLGPVVLGSRLESSLSSGAYQAVVYDKGSVVFSMLARALQPDPFSQMLKALADAVNNRVIDTETFLGAIERMSGVELGEFADQFIYGTGIPEVYYRYQFSQADDGSWTVAGEARQISSGGFRYSLEQTQAGTWHVGRERNDAMDVESSTLVVPFQISLSAGEETGAKRKGKLISDTVTERGLGGLMFVEGAITEFSYTLDDRPDSFWLDQRGEVLARFYCEQREPKRMLRYRAIELAGAGEFDEAESLFEQALNAPLYSEAAGENTPSAKETKRLSKIQDALIHIARTRMYIDQERDADAGAALESVSNLLTGLERTYYRTTRTILRSHLDVRAGDYKAAYQQLSKLLYLDFPFRSGQSAADGARRRKFRSRGRRSGTGRAYALLAITAFETGHEEVAQRALEQAEERGADMQLLKESMPG
ncbi:MAG: M1 family metallopeptidase [bacterium]|nr:M1 family metallopeptidase [bacterium]